MYARRASSYIALAIIEQTKSGSVVGANVEGLGQKCEWEFVS
jgi:hypothetical protein